MEDGSYTGYGQLDKDGNYVVLIQMTPATRKIIRKNPTGMTRKRTIMKSNLSIFEKKV